MESNSFSSTKIQRSFSIDNSSDIERDESNFEQRPQRTSEKIIDITSIEEIITCPIHLGIMVDPRKLRCQHAFCSNCLISFVKSNGKLFCPICRAPEDCTDVLKLPRGLIEKQLIEVLMQHRLSKCSLTTTTESTISKENKVELVNHLLRELKTSSSAIFKFEDQPKTTAVSSDEDHHCTLPCEMSEPSIYSSNYEMLDIEVIREYMLSNSSYTDVKRKSVKRFYKGYQIKKHCTAPTDVFSFDVHLLEGRVDAYEIVFIDSNTNQIFVYSDTEFRKFNINLEGTVVKACYVRIFQNDLYVTGTFHSHGHKYSIFVQCNTYGKVIRKTKVCPFFDINSQLPMMCGFDHDCNNERYYVCLPHLHSIQVYNTSLGECRQPYHFNHNKPQFVTVYQGQNQIWVSCPSDRQIVIADIDSGAFMMFRTDQIDDAIPHMIKCTDDERIIFLDSKSSRFIWIKRRGDFILTQKLNLRSVSSDLEINAFQVLPSSLIVVGTSSEFLVFQPVKTRSKVKGNSSTCSLL